MTLAGTGGPIHSTSIFWPGAGQGRVTLWGTKELKEKPCVVHFCTVPMEGGRGDIVPLCLL